MKLLTTVWFLAGAGWAVSAGEKSAIVLEPVKDGFEVVYVFLPGSYSTNDRYVQFGEFLLVCERVCR